MRYDKHKIGQIPYKSMLGSHINQGSDPIQSMLGSHIKSARSWTSGRSMLFVLYIRKYIYIRVYPCYLNLASLFCLSCLSFL